MASANGFGLTLLISFALVPTAVALVGAKLNTPEGALVQIFCKVPIPPDGVPVKLTV